jgi:hypothetical protein
MWDYYAHTQGGEVVLKSNEVHAGGNMPLLFGNAIMKVSFIKGNEAWGYKTKITTPTLGKREQTSTNRLLSHGL